MIRRLFLALSLLTAIGAGAAHAQSCDTRFNFHNRSSTTVVEFYFDRSSRPDFTRDELGAGTLPSGQTKSFAASYSGLYDFRAVLQDGRRVDLFRIDICRVTDITLTDAGMTAQ
jgi:hypothetical protein